MSDAVPLSTPCSRLMAADQAYHDLMTGGLVRSITDENGEMVSFTQSNLAALLSYIRLLAPLCPTYTPVAIGADLGVRYPYRFMF